VIRYWRADMKGLWGLAYHTPGSGTGCMLSQSPQGWLFSVGVKDRVVGLGWAYRGHKSRTKTWRLD
jgi:hypothetical protein